MERLTKRDEYGNADIIGVDSAELQLNLEFDELNRVTDALNRLATYEDTGLSPEQVLELKEKQNNLFGLYIQSLKLHSGLKTQKQGGQDMKSLRRMKMKDKRCKKVNQNILSLWNNRRLPKKPIVISKGEEEYSGCPVCNEFVFDDYCQCCGQAIDWK